MSNMRKFVIILLLLPLASMADDRAAQNLRAILASIQSLEGKFSQYEFNEDSAELRTLTGEFVMARPLRLFWEIAPPYSQTLVIDGKEIYIYDKDLHQVIIRPLDRQNLPPFFFLEGNDEILNSMEISQPRDGAPVFFLRRLNSAQPDEFFIQFKQGLPYELQWTNPLGQKVVFIFTDLKSNSAIKERTFRFRIPRNAEVIREQSSENREPH